MHPWLEDARNGDEVARRLLVEACEGPLRAFVERNAGARVRRHSPIGDLCQDVFADVFRGLASLPPDADLDTFKGRLIRNARWIIARRARKAGEFHGASAPGAAPPPPATPRETGLVTRNDELARIDALVGRLDPLLGDVVRLRTDGLAFAEIADRLGRNEATVRKQYSRAVAALRERLGE